MLAVKKHKNDHILWSLMLDAMDAKIWTTVNVNKNASCAGCSSAQRRNPRNMAAGNNFCHKHYPLKTSCTSGKMRGQKRAGRFEYCKQDPPSQNNMLLSTIATRRGAKVDDSQSSFAKHLRDDSQLGVCKTFLACCTFVKTHLSSHQSLNLRPAWCYNYNTTSSTRSKHATNKNLKKKEGGNGMTA